MRKVLLVLLALFLLVPFSGAFANDYTNGYVDQHPENIKSLISTVFDNNIGTGYRLEYGRSATLITFNEPVDVIGVYLNSENHSKLTFTLYGGTTYVLNSLNAQGYITVDVKGVTSIRASNSDTSGHYIYEFEVFGIESETEPPGLISNVNVDTTTTTATIRYILPQDSDFSHLNLYDESGTFISQVTSSTYTFESLEPNTTYTYKITSLDESGNESEPYTVTFTTQEPAEVEEIEAVATDKSVELTWVNPERDDFQKVRIYRKTQSEEQTAFETLIYGSVAYASTEYVPLFETNGTQFKDLTVEPETTYEYKLTTTDVSGYESEGVTTTVTTAEEVPPEMGGTDVKQDANGDYLFTWTSPTEGNVKVIVGGEEYSIVPASAGQLLIPKEDMKYSSFGDPDVQAVPISPTGLEGEKENVSGNPLSELEIPFNVNELLQTGMGLLLFLAPIVLLALCFVLLPKLKRAIWEAFKQKRERGA